MNPRRPAVKVPPEKAFPKKAFGILPWRKWKLKKVELVRFPFWAFLWTGKGPGGAWAVDAVDGGFRLLHPEALRREGEGVEPALEFPFLLSREEARLLVKRLAPLHLPLLRRAGLEALPLLEEEGVPMLYPFWAGYLERKGRARPILSDAVTGAPGGPALVRTFLRGLEEIRGPDTNPKNSA